MIDAIAVDMLDETEFDRATELIMTRYGRGGRANVATAERMLTEILEETPDDVQSQAELACAKNEMGNHSDALTILDVLIDRVEEGSLTGLAYREVGVMYNNRGCSLLGLGRPREALSDFERALEQLEHPRDVLRITVHMADTLRALGRHEEAKEKYLHILEELKTARIFGDKGPPESFMIGVKADHGLRALGVESASWTKRAVREGYISQEYVDSLK